MTPAGDDFDRVIRARLAVALGRTPVGATGDTLGDPEAVARADAMIARALGDLAREAIGRRLDSASVGSSGGEDVDVGWIKKFDALMDVLLGRIADWMDEEPSHADGLVRRARGPEALAEGPGRDEAPEPDPVAPPPDPAPAWIPPPAFAGWTYRPVADGPDRHDESAARAGASPEGWPIVGARVRGVKHKHEGTNCDDWFEFASRGPWTLIAVADGAGGYKLSRVGARVACETALRHLGDTLEAHTLANRPTWTSTTFRRDPATGAFDEPDLEVVQDALHGAIREAHSAVERAAIDRADVAEHEATLGRKPTTDDLACTLLLAAHASVPFGSERYSFILTSQVGDGMLAAVDAKGRLQLLGKVETGGAGGQTHFVTMKRLLGRDELWRRTFGFFRPLRALLVMTDGVADLFFPPDPEMLRLYGDLVLNRIIAHRPPSADEVARVLKATSLPDRDAVAKAALDATMEAITASGGRPSLVRQASRYASALGVSIADLVASPALLDAGVRADPLVPGLGAEEQLRAWLDTYQLKGERDDRTLVALSREEVP